jgi:TetR/AcrR family fatty acid metabolism transcriptional regulator
VDPGKKECILVEAARAFARWGFRKTSVDDIAKAAKVAKGTVYLACESKEDLFVQVVERELGAWVAAIAQMMDPAVPADQLLVRMSHAGVTYLDTHPLVQDLLFGRIGELLPALQGRLQQLRADGSAHVVKVLELGVRQGVFRPEIDCEAVASLLQDLQLTTYLFHNHGPDREARIMRRGVAAFDLVLNGLRTPEARGKSLPEFEFSKESPGIASS